MQPLINYDFIIYSFLTAILIGSSLPIIGIILNLKQMSNIVDTSGHFMLASYSLSLAFQAIFLNFEINYLFTTLISSILFILLINMLNKQKKSQINLPIILSISYAITAISLSLSSVNMNLHDYLFGSLSSVSLNNFLIIIFMSFLIFILFFTLKDKIIYFILEQENSFLEGMNIKIFNNIFLFVAVLFINLSIPIVGLFLITSLISIPIFISESISKNNKEYTINAISIGLWSSIFGYIISYIINLPAGPLIISIQVLILLIVVFLLKK